jgi:hypothetical protein
MYQDKKEQVQNHQKKTPFVLTPKSWTINY